MATLCGVGRCVGLVTLLSVGSVWLLGCGDDDAGQLLADSGPHDRDSGFTRCVRDSDCDDGVFCNGVERCVPTAVESDAAGCLAGAQPRCDDRVACTVDVCSHVANACRFTPIDADGDGHPAADCLSPTGEALGDDCDDQDPQRYPGNAEVCTDTTESHDEDCDPATVGHRDRDGDGVVDIACCNTTASGMRCGIDCNDLDRRVHPDYPEICDAIDNDCDSRIDVDVVQATWYPDADGDGFGERGSNGTDSCAPVPDSSLFATDCDDAAAAVSPAAVELCDGIDNDCDGAADEGNVCRCGQQGTPPCECTGDAAECLGGLIPRRCVNGRWVAAAACAGLTPLCAAGRCVCSDGSTGCEATPDTTPPFVLAMAPADLSAGHPTSVTVAVVVSETLDARSVTSVTFRLVDARGVEVAAVRQINGNLVTLNPTAPLAPGSHYDVLFEGVTDPAGNVLVGSRTWVFGTAIATRNTAPLESDENWGLQSPMQLVADGIGNAALGSLSSTLFGQAVAIRPELLRFTPTTGWTDSGYAGGPFLTALGQSGGLLALDTGTQDPQLSLQQPMGTWSVQSFVTPSVDVEALRAFAVAPQDRFAIVLLPRRSGNTTVIDVHAGVIGSAPTKLPSPATVAGSPSEVAVATAGNGHVVVAWTHDPGGGSPASQLDVASWNGTGWARTSFAGLNSVMKPTVVLSESGRVTVAWQQQDAISMSDYVAFYAMPYVATGDVTALGPAQAVAPTWYSGLPSNDPLLRLATDDAGWFLWREGAGLRSIALVPIRADATLGSLVTVQNPNHGTTVGEAHLAVRAGGHAAVMWAEDNPMFGIAQFLSRHENGAWSAPEAIAPGITGALTYLSDGRLLVVHRGGSTGHHVSFVE